MKHDLFREKIFPWPEGVILQKGFLLLLLLLFVVGCSSPYADKVKILDKWAEDVTEREKTLLVLDSAKVKEIALEYATTMAVFRSKMESRYMDTIDQQMANVITNYKGLGKGTTQFFRLYSELKQEAQYSHKQLTDLRGVLKQGKLEEDLAHKYFNDEQLAVKAFLAGVDEIKSLYESIIAIHDTVTPQVKEYIRKY